MPRLFSTVQPRVFGHAVVVVLCLAVAYAGRTNRLSDQIAFWQGQTDSARSASFGNGLLTSDSLVRPPVAETNATPPGRLQTTHYETQPGDTVASLADKFDISENTIIWTNNLPVSGQLDPGRELLILPISGVLYTTKGGESLDDIAQRFQSDSGAIAQVNDLTGQSTPAAGVQLIIPGGRLDENPRPELSGRSTARPNADRVDDTAQATSPPLLSPQLTNDDNPKSTLGIDSAVELVRSLPFVKAADRVKATPTPEPTPLAPIVYHVVDGDTLSAIAEKYGVSADAIAAASGLQGSGDTLAIDQKLLIPPVPGVLHTVQDGDTLGAIADRYGASEADIVHANGLVSPYVLQIGQVLVVPGGSMNPSPAPAANMSETSYQVQDGDSLSSIAQAFGVDLQAVIDANGLQDPYLIHPGQPLMIRGATKSGPDTSFGHPAAAAQAAPALAPIPVAAAAPVVRAAVAAAPKPTVAVAPSRPSSGLGWTLVDVASRYLGTPYVWGGTSPSGFDCSGFVWYVYRKSGLPIPRDMWGQLQSGTRVTRSTLQPGDIVFFAGTYEAGLSHEGIYIGGGRFIHAADYGLGVIVSSFSNAYYANHYFGATRPW
jgi:cell wall-associated NlpC family hydrolase